VFITVRDLQKGQTALKDILGNSKSSQGKVDLLQLDLNSLQSVRDCAADFLSKSKILNVLINNAGVLAYCC
jgi:NAD(P)-dependent dehydrogenase (short-subunit alcohol dehydrogenase family)